MLEQLKLQEQQLKNEYARLRVEELKERLTPHCNVPVTIYREGSRWVCIFEGHPDETKCVVAYGESPKQACDNFDNLWNGAEGFLLDEEEQEEEF